MVRRVYLIADQSKLLLLMICMGCQCGLIGILDVGMLEAERSTKEG